MTANTTVFDRRFLRHVPNLVTIGRAALAVPYFVLMAVSQAPVAMAVSAGLFAVSMAFDIVDGWLARRWHAESALGRILDPVLDKVVICGSLVFCIGPSQGLLAPWMVVLVLARELGVTALRGYVESRGVVFEATLWGKTKTATECIAIGCVLVRAALPSRVEWARLATAAAIWVMMVVVVASGVAYCVRACRIIPSLPPEPRRRPES